MPNIMDVKIDRSLPVTISAQLQGQIEYGIAFGSIPPGSQLPSVRDLARRLEVSPVTVSQVYKALRDKKIIITRRGAGSFVNDEVVLTDRPAQQLVAIQELIDNLLQAADRYGINRADLKRIINLRLDPNHNSYNKRSLNIVFVGNFLEATRSYAAELSQYLMPDDIIVATTLDQLSEAGNTQQHIHQADLIITLAHRLNEVRKFLKPEIPVTLLNFIPSEHTRTALAELNPTVRIGLISTYPEFLSSLKAMVLNFAPHVEVVNTAIHGTPQVSNAIHYSDVVVYTTGSEEVLEKLPERMRAIEFRYVPDPHSIEKDLAPLLKALRHHRRRTSSKA